jgi:hypothetical protein
VPYEEIDVPELDREMMQATADRIRRLSDEHWWALHPTCSLMEKDIWLGPAGLRFGAEVHADQRGLRELLSQALNAALSRLGSP